VAVTIRCPHPTPAVIHSELRRGEISTGDATSKLPVFHVRLRSPFVVAADQLNTPKETSHGHCKFWERQMTDHYTLEIEIACLNASDTAELWAKLAGGTPADYAAERPGECSIKAVWGDPDNPTSDNPGLPALPPDGTLLRLQRPKGPQSLDLPYGLQPNMSWNTRSPAESIIATHNQLVRQLRSAQQMPTPSPSEDAEPLGKRRCAPRSVRYQFWTGGFVQRSIHLAEVNCIFCPHDQEHSSIARLYGHYATYHDHFSILAEEDSKDSNVTVFKFQLKEELREIVNEPTKDNFDWTAPEVVFDANVYMERHSRGERSRWETKQAKPMAYIGERPIGGKTMTGKSRRGRPMAPELPALELAKHKTKNMPPEEVPDLPDVKRKRRTVPHVPGIDFYRTTSKHVLNPGDQISDSDEDPDEFWLVERQCHDLCKMGLDKVTQQFHILMNRHMDKERPMSDMLVRDALVRLARQHGKVLVRPAMYSLFRQKLELLNRGRTISEKEKEYCLQLVAGAALNRDGQISGIQQDALRPSQSEPILLNSQSRIGENPTTQRGASEPWSPPPPQSRAPPFGRRKYICKRMNGSKPKPYHGDIKDLVKDGEVHESIDDIKPRQLCWTKFNSVLDNQLVRIRTLDDVVYVSSSGRPAALVTDEKDWYEVLERAAQEWQGDSTVLFELHPVHSRRKVLAENHFGSQQPTEPETSSSSDVRTGVQDDDVVVVVQGARASSKPPRRPCDCGEVVRGLRGTIACGNPMCERDYHLACVGLQKRPIDWKCPGCANIT
jgi:hypothetical protein